MEEDLSKGIHSINMDSYRAVKTATIKILLPDTDAEIDPLPPAGAGRKPEPELEYLSEILKTFNPKTAVGSRNWHSMFVRQTSGKATPIKRAGVAGLREFLH